MYKLNQIPYEYAVELVNRFKWLDLVNSVPEELWREVHNTCAVQFSSVAPVVSDSSRPHESQHARAVHHISVNQSSLRLMSIESVMPSSHLILCCPLLLLPPIPTSIRVFSKELAPCIRWPKYWSFSFSVSPSNESSRTDFLYNLLVSSCSPRDSQESSPPPQFKSINSSVFSLLHSPTLTSIHDYWKNHSFD